MTAVVQQSAPEGGRAPSVDPTPAGGGAGSGS